MSNWNEIELGELAEITSSKRIFRSEYVPVGVPFYRSKEIIEKSKNNSISTELFITEERFNEIKNKFGIPVNGDLLMTAVGTLGVVYQVKDHDNFYFKDGNLIWFKDIDCNKTLSDYLFYLLRSDVMQQRMKGVSIGSSQGAFTISAIKKIKAKLPDVKTQKKISNTLAAYDKLITNNFQRIKILEQIAQAIYNEWFVNFRFPGHENTKSKNGTPQGWSVLKIENLCEIFRGKSYKSSELSNVDGLPFVNLKCISRNGGFRKSGLKRFTGSFKDTQSVKERDIVMAVTDMTQDRAIVARAARVPILEAEGGVISMDVVKIQANADIDSEYLYSLLRWSDFPDNVKNHANGANVLHLSPDRIKDYKVLVADKEIRDVFGKLVGPMFDLINKLESENEVLTKTRDLLIPKLVTGEIEIKA